MSARGVVAAVVDPELPMLTLDDLGVIRSVTEDGAAVTVTITPTYSGCPAVQAMCADIRAALLAAGYRVAAVRTVLSPAWSTDWITEAGRRKLSAAGIAPPGPARPVTLTLAPPPVANPAVPCPRCGAPDTEELSRFGPTACTALRRCRACREPFEHVRAL